MNSVTTCLASNGDDLVARLRLLERFVFLLGAERVVGLGNSMGGYGAILTSRALDMQTCLALVPQFSVDDRVIAETRWARLRAGLGKALVPSLEGSFVEATRYRVVHGRHPQDAPHYTRFPVAPNIHHYLLPQGGHDVAHTLKAMGVLPAVVSASLRGDLTAADQLLRRVGGVPRPDWKEEAA